MVRLIGEFHGLMMPMTRIGTQKRPRRVGQQHLRESDQPSFEKLRSSSCGGVTRSLRRRSAK